MQVRIPRDDRNRQRADWIGSLTVLGSLPGLTPARSGARWQASLSGLDLHFRHEDDAARVVALTDVQSASPVDLPNGTSAVALEVARNTLLLVPVVSLLGRRGGRAAGLLDALAAHGVPVLDPRTPPMLTDPSGTVWSPHEDTIVWSGRASLPSHPWLLPQPAHVWLTTRALRWSIDGVRGFRLPLDQIDDCAPVVGNRAPTEAVVRYREPNGSSHILAVRFDQHGPDRAHRERGAFLVALRSRGVRCPVEPAPVAVQEMPRRPREQPHPLRTLVTTTQLHSDRPLRPAPPLPAMKGPGASDLATARAVEATLLETIHRLNRSLTGHGLEANHADDLGAPLGSGLADLDAAERSGGAPAADVAARRSRMLALAEAATRLRSLVDLRDRGHLAGQDLDGRRRAILAGLEPHLLA